MLDLIKKYKRKIIFYAITVFFIFLLAVQIPYWFGKEIALIKTDFEAPEVLNFLGNYISAFGTIVLGWIAIKQTDKANETSDNVAKLEKAKYDEKHRPSLIIDWIKLHDYEYNYVACNLDFNGRLHYVDANYEKSVNEERQCFEIKFLNTGHSGIYNCDLIEINSMPKELIKDIFSLFKNSDPFVLKSGEELNFNLFVYPNVIDRFALREINKIQLVFSCVNDFNEKYKLIFDIEGAIVFEGNNRCEGFIANGNHPIKWNCIVEKEE